MSRPFPSRYSREPLHRRNGKIRAREVRVLDENKQQLGVMSLNDALRLAMDRHAARSQPAEGLLDIIAEYFPGGICVFDANLRMVMCNSKLKQSMALHREDSQLLHLSHHNQHRPIHSNQRRLIQHKYQ